MESVLQFIGLVFAPLASPLFLVVLIAGFVFGMVYIYRLNIDNEDIFHIAMSGWVFLFTIFIFRLATYITEGTVLTQAAGWLGISVGWGLYCASILMGALTLKRFTKRFRRP